MRRPGQLIWTLCSLALIGAACSSQPADTAVRTVNPKTPVPTVNPTARSDEGTVPTSTVPTSVDKIVSIDSGFPSAALPTGYGMPNILATDPSTSGVWFFAESATSADVFHWDSASLSSWSVGNPVSDGLAAGIRNAITIDQKHRVWVGVNSTLIEFDPTTGQNRKVVLPEPPTSSAAQAHLPPILQNFFAIESISSDDSGHIAVAWSGAGAVTLFDSSTGQVSGSVALPVGTEATTLAYSTTNTLAIGLTDYTAGGLQDEVLLYYPDSASSKLVSPVSSWSVSRAATGFVTGADGGSAVNLVSDDGVVTVLNIASEPERPIIGGNVVASASYVFQETQTGLLVDPIGSGQSTAFTMPDIACAEGSGGPPSPDTTNPPTTNPPTTNPPTTNPRRCGGRASVVAVDASGTIWYANPLPSPTIGSISAADYSGN